MRFWKYHGIGNDFVVIDNRSGKADVSEGFVKRICDRNFGVGADGILYITEADNADIGMKVMNADGSEAEMCGNGIRCVAKHAYDLGIVKKERFDVRTLAGILSVRMIPDGLIEVDMGAPVLNCSDIPMNADGRFIDSEVIADSIKIKCTAVSMGNPHLVTFDDLTEDMKKRLGPILESHPLFPKRTNVEFADVTDGKINVKVYERGAAWTLACGTGACATAVAAALKKLIPYGVPVDVELPGGLLKITVAEDLSSVTMAGPAELVYEGNIISK
ncbi:MAG: diaminopimelate epimerase [Methanomassiliicoccaceae archaeon]|nr:diaminopimelate epimerase [Methanomassiliicoccaceae archaeon]